MKRRSVTKFDFLTAKKHELENENNGVSAASAEETQGTIAVPVYHQEIVVIIGVVPTISFHRNDCATQNTRKIYQLNPFDKNKKTDYLHQYR